MRSRGRTFEQTVDSIQADKASLTKAGAEVGLKVQDRVREHDVVHNIF